MRVTKEIPIDLIDVVKTPLNKKVVRFTYALQAMAVFPAIKVARKPHGRFEIRDGRYRLVAHKLLGRDKILAKFSTDFLKDMKAVKRQEQLRLDILDILNSRPDWED